MSNHFYVLDDPEQMSIAAANFLMETAVKVIEKKGRFVISLAGGSTPKKMYQLLGKAPFKDAVAWNKFYVLFGDERCVPETSPDSNSRMAKEAWLNKVSIPADQIFLINGTLPPAEAAQRYENDLKSLFANEEPVIDLCFLGLGDDGHTASLFPRTEALQENEKWVTAVHVEKMDSWRISLTAPFLKRSDQIAFLVSGEKKANILPKVINGAYRPTEYPAQLILKGQPNVHWFLDEAAASRMK